MMDKKEFKPRLRPYQYPRCPICTEEVGPLDDYLVSRMKRGGDAFIHRRCWEKEQTERSKEVRKK